MTEQPAPSKATKPFVIGLAIGLVVGGLAGTLLSEFGSSQGIPRVKSPPAKPGAAAPSRDERPPADPPTPAAPTGAPTGVETPPAPGAPK